MAARFGCVSPPTHRVALDDPQEVAFLFRQPHHLIAELVEHSGKHLEADAELHAQRHPPHGQVGDTQHRLELPQSAVET